jgi:2-hydroxychromene-2-carboxylate isomerase
MQNLSDDTVLRELLENVGVPATMLMAEIEREEVKDRLRQNTDRAIGRGVFGAPTFFVGGEMFWGNDRFDFVEEALRKLVLRENLIDPPPQISRPRASYAIPLGAN